MYDFIHPDNELLNHTWSMTDGDLLDSYNELYPSYVFPPALLRHFGSVEALEEFFVLVGDTYLSCDHLFKKEWNWFLANNIDLKTFFSWWKTAVNSGHKLESLCSIPEVLEFLIFLHTSPSIEKINLFFNPTPGRKSLINFTTHIAIKFVLFSQEKDLIPVMKFLGLPQSLEGIFVLSPYKIAVKLFESYADKDELLTALNATSFNKKKSRFFVEYLIYLNNTPLKADYNIFFKQG